MLFGRSHTVLATVPVILCWSLIPDVGAAETISPVVREGADWVQTVSGSFTAAASARLRVTTIGKVVLLGGPADRVSYTVKKRVAAGSREGAEAAFRNLVLRSREQGGWTNLILSVPTNQRCLVELTITAPRDLALARLDTGGGAVTASGFNGEISIQTGGGSIDLDALGSDVEARTGGGRIQVGRVAGRLRAYTGGGAILVSSVGRECWLDTAGGDIVVREAAGPLHATTSGGSIHVDRAANQVYARTSGGAIDVGQAGGLVTAETSGGAIQVDGARGVRCESSAGTIRLRNIQGAVRARAHGSILAQLQSGQHLEDSTLSAVMGDIIVLLSSNTPVTIQARNESAGSRRRIISEFREIRIRNADGESNDPVFADGALNGGGPVLRIVTSSGLIFLRRQK